MLRCISGLNAAAGYGCFRTNPIPSSGSYDLIHANTSPPPVSPDARLSQLFNSRLCHEFQSFSFRVVSHCAGRVKVHRCTLLGSVCGPVWQTVVIRISSSGKIHPGGTDLLRQSECLRSTPTVMVANFSIVECERDFTGVEGTGAIVQHGRPPRVYIRVCRRTTQSSLPAGLLEGRASKRSRCDCRVQVERRRFGIVSVVRVDDLLGAVAEFLPHQSVNLFYPHAAHPGAIKPADGFMEICASEQGNVR